MSGRLLTDAELRAFAASSMRKLVARLAEDLDDIVGDLGEDAAAVTVAELLADEAHQQP